MKWVWRGLAAIVALLIVGFLVFRTPDTDPAAMRAKYGGPPSEFVEIDDGVRVHVRDEGPRDAPAIMLLHGSNADLHSWDPWAKLLRDEYRIVRFDQVGHGLTGPDPDADYSRENYTADIGEVADALGLDQFILGGHSMGGKHALSYAMARPDRVMALVLIGASGPPMPQDDGGDDADDGGNIGFAIARTPGINTIARQITPRAMVAESLKQSVSVQSVASEEAIDRYWELLRYPGNRQATLERFSTPYEPLEKGEIAELSMPALLIWGEEDRLIPLEAGRWLVRTLGDAELVALSGIGHLPHEEAPRSTARRTQDWLESRNITSDRAD